MRDRSGVLTDMSEDVGGEQLTSAESKDIAKKVLVMSIATVSMILYESYNVDQLKTQANGLAQAVNREKNVITKLKKEMAEYADVEKDAKVLEDKINILKTLSKIRLREVKALDFIQTITPETVWFSSIKYSEGQFEFQGYAVTDDDLSQFMRELENSPYFVDVILMRAKEEQTKQGTVKAFEIQSRAGDIG